MFQNLKNKIQETLSSYGFSQNEDSWFKEEVVTRPGQIVNINGQIFQQPGDQINIQKHFTILSECEIKDLITESSENTIMCHWEVKNDDRIIVDFEINLYPDDFVYFVKLTENLFK